MLASMLCFPFWSRSWDVSVAFSLTRKTSSPDSWTETCDQHHCVAKLTAIQAVSPVAAAGDTAGLLELR